ncbi:hypothetical protein AB0J86_38480 [Micromonospora sp. NPDC049559]|uniref:hypothetical protein n=1 Tax=Micromonospora sp. NPDC049559 TaxID=3155923 RepID=UPI00343274D3
MSDRQVPLPPGTPGASPARIAAGIHDWITSEPVRSLVAAFGGRYPDGDTAATLAWLDDFSARHWDFRRGRERPEATEPALDPATARLVRDAARALGMVEAAPPPRSAYAYLLVLGGLAHGCLRRTRYAARLLRDGLAVTGEVAVLGSFRPLSPAERELLDRAGFAGCATEVDALEAGVRAAFDCPEPERVDSSPGDDPHRSWSVRRYRPTGLPPVRVLAAPSSDPAVRRAHTADTQLFWAGQVALAPGDPTLMVTAPIYVPFQHCDAVRTLALPSGCGIETVGVDPGLRVEPEPEPALTPGRYLQEVRSALRSMRALHAAL